MKHTHLSLLSRVSALAVAGAGLLNVGCAHGDVLELPVLNSTKMTIVVNAQKKPAAKVQIKANAELRVSTDYPRMANGNWDWKQSPDIKNGVVSPLLLKYFQTAQDFYDAAGFSADVAQIDQFVADDFGNIKSESGKNCANLSRIGLFVAAACYINQNITPDADFFNYRQQSKKYNLTYYSIATDAAKVLLDPRSKDEKMKLLCASVVEDFSRFSTHIAEGYTGYGIQHLVIDAKNDKALKAELLNKALGTASSIWFDINTYTRQDRNEMATTICHGIALVGAKKYAAYLKEDKSPRPTLKGNVILSAQNALNAPNLRFAARP